MSLISLSQQKSWKSSSPSATCVVIANPSEPLPENCTLETSVVNDAFDCRVAYSVGPQVSPQSARFDPGFCRSYRNKPKGCHAKRNGKQVYDRHSYEIIGETSNRTDRVPFRHGKLGFIGYEYEGHEIWC